MSTPRPNTAKRYESFAASVVLPGESAEDFTDLVFLLRNRLEPHDFLEDDLVVTIAKFSWRKRRLGIFRIAAEARAKFGAYFAEGDVELGVIRVYQHRFHELHARVQ